MTFEDHPQTLSIVPLRRSALAVAALRTPDGVYFPLAAAQRRWTIGSARSCDVVLEDRCVSSLHCVLERVGHGELVIRDRESRNGTYLDGHAIEGAMLSVGSRLRLGNTVLVAVAGEQTGTAWHALRGKHPSFVKALRCAERAAASECSVLIVGETGTGKDLFARAIHERSRRAAAPFIAVNCGAIPRELIASELFGHERGAFTGATTERAGYFAEAEGGTLFLDELGELPLELQPHLLRALENRAVRRVGGTAERPVDVRVIAATNRLEGLGTDASRLRLDLFHRIAAVVISLPPLRARASDVRLLVEHFLSEAADGRCRAVAAEAWEALESYDWPGNARELRHAVARALTLGDGELGARDFFADFVTHQSTTNGRNAASGVRLAPYETSLYDEMMRALTLHGSIRAAAASIGMPKSTFADRAHQWGLVQLRAVKKGA
ncbi:MAG: sigma 54-interacting transcriptional regulator [Kofleriaceae bacterium]